MEHIDFREHFQKLSEKGIVNTSFKGLLTEAISAGQFSKAALLIQKFLKNTKSNSYTDFKLYGEPKSYTNNIDGQIVCIEYFFDKGKKKIRFNWGKTGVNSNELLSVDLWLSNKSSKRKHLSFDRSVSLVKTLPQISAWIENPNQDSFLIIPPDENITESFEYLTEARTATFSKSDIWKLAMEYMVVDTVPQVVLRPLAGGQAAASLVTKLKEMYPEYWDKKTYKGDVDASGKDLAKSRFGKDVKKIWETLGWAEAEVKDVAPQETDTTPISPVLQQIQDTKDIKTAKDIQKVSYEETLERITRNTNYLLKNVKNCMFIFGRGGVSKSYSLKKYLNSNGYSDGKQLRDNASVWISGAMTPVALYKKMALNPNALFFIDDCDSIFDTTEGRNIIKKATEAEYERTINWEKSSSGGDIKIKPAAIVQKMEDDGEDTTLIVPDKFIFTGKIIFISNLNLDKLDPDKAIRTRGFMVPVYPEDEEIYQYMKKIASIPNSIDLSNVIGADLLSEQEIQEVVEKIWEYYQAGIFGDLNLRLIDSAVKIRSIDPDYWEEGIKTITLPSG